MKRIATAGLVLTLSLLFAAAALAGETKAGSGWFDFVNCEFCKALTVEPGLLDNTTWESHPTNGGMINIMTVKPEYAAAMAKAEAHMQQVGVDIQSGKVNPMTLKMCGHCQTFGMLMMQGVQVEEVRGEAAIVTMFTSDDKTVVKGLQDLAKRNTEEMAAMPSSH